MDMATKQDAPPRVRPSRIDDRAFDAVAALLVFLAYFAVFLAVRTERSVSDAALSALINLAALLLVAAPARALLKRYVLGAAVPRQIVVHIAIAAAFSILWHWLLMVAIGIRAGGSFTEFAVRAFFPTPAFAWQLLQGTTVYALVAALTYLRARPDMPSLVVSGDGEDPREPALSRYFIRRGDDIHPVDVSQIVSITGADDYAEVATVDGSHLVRTTLAEFEVALDPARFLRVHRSRIVNLDRISRAEPAGDGKILLHMQGGQTIQTSRNGAKLFRERVV